MTIEQVTDFYYLGCDITYDVGHDIDYTWATQCLEGVVKENKERDSGIF